METVKVMLKILLALVAVAFFTLYERKVLSYMQFRKGPSKAMVFGLGQPFADAVKLLSKESFSPKIVKSKVFILAPVFQLALGLAVWISLPDVLGGVNLELSMLMALCIMSGGVFPLLLAGWGSKSMFSSLGGMRSLAQTVSYEVILLFIFTLPACLSGSLKMETVLMMQTYSPLVLFGLPAGLLVFICSLAELGRSPFDFMEGESELVSGFNTEYGGGLFALIFMAEYSSIIFLSMALSWMYLSPLNFPSFVVVSAVLLCFSYIWLRGSFPRYRYDKLMGLTWKSFLVMTLALYFVFLTTKSLILT